MNQDRIKKMVFINGKEYAIENETNLLELIRKTGIDLPTFCYHSELSVYGACRLCVVDIEGRGIVTSCSTKPEPGMKILTHTEELRDLRKIAVELLLANHDNSCTTCTKSGFCQLQSLAKRLGVDSIRFKRTHQPLPLDDSTVSLIRDPNKCVLCGDCVRYCREIQGVGAIDFVHRGSSVQVAPAFGKNLNQVECVYCGQCARVCPTGAITPRSQEEQVWKALHDPNKTVVAQIAPAVRVAIGEYFGADPGQIAIGQTVAAMKRMGFDKVFDTSFAADLTVIEEATEFLTRFSGNQKLPQFTSCCPAWVKYAEQYYPSLLTKLSSCRSPQQMFGSLARTMLPEILGIEPQNLVIVSIMPCTAKKFEATRPEFSFNGKPDVEYVLTTQELAHMMENAGFRFSSLTPESLDLPLGFKTGAGVIFGSSGGVTEAVLRYALEKATGTRLESIDFPELRGEETLKDASFQVGTRTLKIAIVHGLAQAGRIAKQVLDGSCDYDLVEVMACPGGCIGGAGQPIPPHKDASRKRSQALYEADKMLQLHKSQENHMVAHCYQTCLGEANGQRAHQLLHTHYQSRRRIEEPHLPIVSNSNAQKVEIRVCVGTSCHVRGSQDLLRRLMQYIEKQNLMEYVDIAATFCFERCGEAPNVKIGDELISRCTFEKACQALHQTLQRTPVAMKE